MNVAANIAGTRHISLRAVISCFGSPTADGGGFGPGVVAAAGELSQEEGELGLQSLVVGGPAVFLVDIWGLAESLVPAYTSSSIFCEKLRSGDAGERDNVSGEMGSASGVSDDCDVLSLASQAVFQKVVLGC